MTTLPYFQVRDYTRVGDDFWVGSWWVGEDWEEVFKIYHIYIMLENLSI